MEIDFFFNCFVKLFMTVIPMTDADGWGILPFKR